MLDELGGIERRRQLKVGCRQVQPEMMCTILKPEMGREKAVSFGDSATSDSKATCVPAGW
jgi:hypothetical protein